MLSLMTPIVLVALLVGTVRAETHTIEFTNKYVHLHSKTPVTNMKPQVWFWHCENRPIHPCISGCISLK
jgi:hypothetical protein